MSKRRTHDPEFRRRIVVLVRGGQTIESLSREFGPSWGTIQNWVKQADRDEGRSAEGFTTEEKAEMRRLRRENARLREERDIPKKSRGVDADLAAAVFTGADVSGRIYRLSWGVRGHRARFDLSQPENRTGRP